MKTISFHRVDEVIPKNGQEIWYIQYNKFYDTYQFINFKVRYQWLLLNEEGKYTGDFFEYVEREEHPEHCVLSCGLSNDTLWCSELELYKSLMKG